jgi:hypothetical protein
MGKNPFWIVKYILNRCFLGAAELFPPFMAAVGILAYF